MEQNKEEENNHFEILAYKKAYLHALRYISDDVIGILVGQIDGKKIKVKDSYPLFHTRILAPSLETAFEIVESYIEDKDLQIVGIYTGFIDIIQSDKPQILDIEQKILDRIQDKIKVDPILMRIQEVEIQFKDDQENNFSQLSSTVYQVSWKNQQDVVLKEIKTIKEGSKAFRATEQNILNDEHRQIVDFDLHFEEITADFTNKFVE